MYQYVQTSNYIYLGGEEGMYQYVQTSNGNVVFHPNGSLVIKSVTQAGNERKRQRKRKREREKKRQR